VISLRPKGTVLALGLQDAFDRREFASSRGRTVSDPIFLLAENQESWSARKEAVNETNTKIVDIPLSPALPPRVLEQPVSLREVRNQSGLLTRALNWIRNGQLGRSSKKRLQVAGIVSLGEKRIVAVIQIDGLQFLVGGGASNVTLLAQLDGKGSFGTMLKEGMALPPGAPVNLTAEQRGEIA
jgi:hypothetical protein